MWVISALRINLREHCSSGQCPTCPPILVLHGGDLFDGTTMHTHSPTSFHFGCNDSYKMYVLTLADVAVVLCGIHLVSREIQKDCLMHEINGMLMLSHR